MTVFDLALQLPPDGGFAPMVRDLALHGARQAGCAEAMCVAFGREVENAARDVLSSATATVAVAVRRDAGPVEIVIGSRTLRLEV